VPEDEKGFGVAESEWSLGFCSKLELLEFLADLQAFSEFTFVLLIWMFLVFDCLLSTDSFFFKKVCSDI